MRLLPALLALPLLAAPAFGASELPDLVDHVKEGVTTAVQACSPPGGLPDLQCLRQRLQEICHDLRDCTAICDSFEPGFETAMALDQC